MRKFTILILVGLVCIIILGYIGIMKANNIINAKPNGITFDDLQIGDLKVGMLYDEVIEIKGNQPKKIEKGENGVVSFLEYDDGINIALFESRVQVLSVNNPSYATARGLKVGDNKDKALRLYGKHNTGSAADSIWEYSNDEGSFGLNIFFKEDIVTYIQAFIRAM